MICPSCFVERKETDFQGKTICYKCVYKGKLAMPKNHGSIECKWCGDQFERGERWIYCSFECQQKAEAKQKRDYWTNKVDCPR